MQASIHPSIHRSVILSNLFIAYVQLFTSGDFIYTSKFICVQHDEQNNHVTKLIFYNNPKAKQTILLVFVKRTRVILTSRLAYINTSSLECSVEQEKRELLPVTAKIAKTVILQEFLRNRLCSSYLSKKYKHYGTAQAHLRNRHATQSGMFTCLLLA